MKSYFLYVISSLLFYIGGVVLFASSHNILCWFFIAFGCVYFAIALGKRKTKENEEHKDE